MSSFHTLVQSGSYLAAARALNIEVEELDRHIFELECLLSTPLFHRRAEGTESFAHLHAIPTDSGTRWFLIVKELLSCQGSEGFDGLSKSFIECMERTLSYLMNNSAKVFPQSKCGNQFTCVSFFQCL